MFSKPDKLSNFIEIKRLTVKPAIVLVLSLMLALWLAACSGTSEGISSPALVSKVTRYEIDYQTGEWYQKEDTEFEYENSFPVSIKSHDYDAEMDSSQTFEYEFNGDLPVKMKRYNSDGDHDMTASYTKKGLRNRDHFYNEGGTREIVYQYGNRDQYFTLVHHEALNYDPENPDGPKDHMEEVDSVIVTSEDGLLRKTVNDGLYANWGDLETKEWHRFFGSYTMEYDPNGIAALASAKFSIGTNSGPQEKYEVTISNGRVTEAVLSRNSFDQGSDEEGTWEAAIKYVFEYTDTEISADRYASMINDFLLEGGGTYYIYNWY